MHLGVSHIAIYSFNKACSVNYFCSNGTPFSREKWNGHNQFCFTQKYGT